MKIETLKYISKDLQNAFLLLKTKDEVFNFLRDLLTENEILEFSQRFEIAKMLYEWISYKEIEKTTWASSTTVARVGSFLNWEYWWYKNIIEKNLPKRDSLR